jgi:catechol 2,3-dioxygenase-like lactoylglutathione lyase family enzyme
MVSRRHVLKSLPALMAAPAAARLFGQAARPQIAVRSFSQMTLSVSDMKRSLEFYQRLFGMPIQARQGPTVLLRIGAGPQFLGLTPAGSAGPGFSHYGLAVETFNADRLVSTLAEHGVTKADPGAAGLSGGPMKVRVRPRGPDAGGAKEGTTEVFVGDPDGVVFQLQDPSYCGGAGAKGEVCAAAVPSATPGLIAVKDISHFTIATTDPTRTNAFYKDLFGFGVRAMQATTPAHGVGKGIQFLMFTGGAAAGRGGAAPRPARIDHACLNLEKFNVDEVQKKLESVGIKPRGTAAPGAPAAPLVHYVSMRMENRGGAPGGTPELYFTDPDGLAIQLQDVSYCGGGGYLGNTCLS